MPARLTDDERGLTLVELLVYMVLISLVLIMVGNLMIQSLRVQHSTTSTNEASNEAQAVLTSLELAVRNSTRIDHRAAGGDELLVVTRRSTTTSTGGVCQGWFYDSGTRSLHAVTDRASGTPRTAGAWTGGGDASAWPVVLEEVEPIDATMFVSGAQGPLQVGLRVGTSRYQTPIEFETTVRQRAGSAPAGGVSCT